MKTKTKPRERGLAFAPEMVQAIIDQKKSQTRRPIKWKLREGFKDRKLSDPALELGTYFTDVAKHGFVLRARRPNSGAWDDWTLPAKCPWGEPGDLIWVKEVLRVTKHESTGFRVRTEHEGGGGRFFHWHETTHNIPKEGSSFRQAMPKQFARIWLEIVSVRAQRLQAISPEDAQDEGIERVNKIHVGQPLLTVEPFGWRDYTTPRRTCFNPRYSFASLWNSIYGRTAHAWTLNPAVWAIEFKLHERSILS